MPVTRIEIQQRGALAGGRAFGAAGAYEYLAGVLRFESDPRHPDHAVICELQLAPGNAAGKVAHRAQFHLLKPLRPAPHGRVRVDSINRDNMTAVAMFNSVPRRTGGNPDIVPGNGFLFREG
jgi:hypothetical protein